MKPKQIDWSKAPFTYVDSKRGTGKCAAYGCSCKASPRKRYLCSRHAHMLTKYLDPVYYRYMLWKSKAKQRGKEFTIRLSWFRAFCEETGYIIDPQKRGKDCTVDRRENWRGYHEDNIQLLTGAENTRKYYDHDRHQPEGFQVPDDYLVSRNAEANTDDFNPPVEWYVYQSYLKLLDVLTFDESFYKN